MVQSLNKLGFFTYSSEKDHRADNEILSLAQGNDLSYHHLDGGLIYQDKNFYFQIAKILQFPFAPFNPNGLHG